VPPCSVDIWKINHFLSHGTSEESKTARKEPIKRTAKQSLIVILLFSVKLTK
jgi:hypothetical protein